MDNNFLLSYLVVTYIILMMFINFWIIGHIVIKEYVNRRVVLFLSSIILYMAVESIALGYIVFHRGEIFIEPILLLFASVPLFLSSITKNMIVRLKSDIISSLLLSGVIVFDEISMGYLYSSAFGPHSYNPFIDSVSNVAFGIMMIIDGLFFLFIARVKNIIEFALTTFTISMAFLPSLFIEFPKLVQLFSSLVSTAIMIINIIMLYLIEIKRVTFQGQLIALSLALFDFLMMLGLLTFASFNDMWLISLSVVISMMWYFIAVLYEFPNKRIEMKLRYPFIFLVLINLAELSMGFGESVFGFNITNSVFVNAIPTRSPPSNPFWWLFPINPLLMGIEATHATNDLVINAILTSYMFLMATTMEPFYVIMMGIEMSYLVYERYKKAKNLSVKNWALIIVLGVPIFTVLIPYYTNIYVFGMSGMIFRVTLLSFTISIISVIVATILFGRRAYCNAVCMSAHMWTNIFYDQFKPKRSSRVWEYVRWTFLAIMLIAFLSYIMIELKLLAPIKIGMITLDPLNFYGMFTVNYIWWIFYFLTPFFGAYSCARQGWCGFGTFTGLFNKVLFKIRAKDVSVCENCETHACDMACPIKIPISDDILKKGYSNRINCVGCGDCIEDCTYNNLEIIDIISFIKK
ncbi:4Fe-4S ferredoxin [Sulfolobus tengchongensis]|uniref:4Fe-4S ferredoxin n=1 Tax=Sulfolobus tengchongensis TaxID=207809 RepID=A0AAX4L3P4_9CREN